MELPEEIQEILNDTIIQNEFGVGLNKIFIPKEDADGYGLSYFEDLNNHFHLDKYVKKYTSKEVFMLGIMTIKLLAKKFENSGMSGIRLWLSFSSPEMCKKWAIKNGFHEDGDEYYISDRLSFYTQREGQEVISIDFIDNIDGAILIIDV